MNEDFHLEMRVCRVVLKIFGVWPRNRNVLSYVRFIIFLAVTNCFTYIPQSFRLLGTKCSFDEVLEILSNVNLTIMLAIFKGVNIWINRKALKKLISSMAQDWKDARNQAEKLIMKQNAKLSNLSTMIILGICECAVFSCLGLNGYIRFKESQMFNDGKINATERTRPLFFLSSFPFDAQQSPYYEIIWFGQFMSTVFGSAIFSAADGFYATLVLHLCAQMKILREQLKNLMIKAATRENSYERLDLSAIIRRHQYLIRFAGMIESVFNVQSLVHLLSSLLIFCLIGYQIVLVVTQETVSALEVFHAAYYYMSFAASLFLCCLIAVTLSTESTKLADVAYDGEWYRLPAADAKLLIMIIMRTSKPLELTAGKFVPLSLDLYCSVMKTSGGYLSMLLAMRTQNLTD